LCVKIMDTTCSCTIEKKHTVSVAMPTGKGVIFAIAMIPLKILNTADTKSATQDMSAKENLKLKHKEAKP